MNDGIVDVTVDLVVVEQFLNTLDERTFSWHGERHTGHDGLTSVQALSGWLEAHGLVTAGQELGPADLTAAVALRDGLRAALIDDGDGAKTAQALAAFPLRLAPDSSGRLRLAATSGTAGLDAIVETVASNVAGGGWSRLKLCSSTDCRWAFYDTSRNGGGRWCSMEACGNRNKTRAYRRRHAD
ncbi:CGNR zinc finger domain-containing protein [Streptacidiphilus sp. N1-12]|uniref:CGNR zinc finger domain-containing protein n=2 Tax=Streptacidiphilus alkalitolerans TaxID=3342712 RepID=A0ABV6VDP1_9ACTN